MATMTPQRRDRLQHVLQHRQIDLCVVLENVHDPHNISAVMRSCDAVGIMEIFVINTTIPRHKKFGRRSSSSASKWIKVHQYTDLAACMHEVASRYHQILCTHLNESAKSLYELPLTLPTALVFGNEHHGVSEEMLGYCTGNFIIPQVGMIQSLNISVACAVSIYEAFRQKLIAGHYAQQSLSEAQASSLVQYWHEDRFLES